MTDKRVEFEITADGAQASQVMDQVNDGLNKMGTEAVQAEQDLAGLRQEIDAKSAAIKASLQAEQAEIELRRSALNLAREEQQALLKSAQARGDEAAATQAQNRLRDIEGQQLALIARAKRAEAAAVQQAVDARRQELAAVGPLSKAQSDELRAAENHVKALRTEAAAADVAARSTRDLAIEQQKGASTTDQLSARLSGITRVLGGMAAAMGVAFSFRELVTAAAQMEQLRSGLTAVSGDAAKAGQELEFVRTVAARIGADVTEVGKAFLGLSAATRGTAVEGKPTREVFDAVATAMGKAGKSSAETANALNALAQMASKGVVQSEELRGQLGEALPGALNAAAKGMGITTKELLEMVESGQVLASDLFPALSKGLNELYGAAPQAQTLSQEITNIKNAVTDLGSNLGESGGLSVLKTGAEVAQTAIVFLDAALVALGKKIGVVMAAIASADFSGLKDSFADIEREAQDKLLKSAQHNDVLRSAIQGVGGEAIQTRLAQQEQAAATASAGAAAAGAAPGYIALANAYNEAKKNVEAATALAEKEVAAVKARGEAAVAEAKLKNDEALLRAAVGKAAANEAAALADLAMRRQAEVTVLQLELKSKQEAIAASGDASSERKKEIEDLQQLIVKKQIEADTSRAQAAASQANARAKGEEAQAAEALLSKVQVATTQRVADAKANLSLLETQRSLAQQSEQLYRLMGNEEAAREARIQQLQIDIQITRAKAEVQRAEAEGSIAVAQASLEELRAKGQLTAVKEAELQASIKLAQAKLKEADAIRESAKVTEQAVANLRNFGSEATNAAGRSDRATDRIAGGWDKVAGSIDKATVALGSYSSKGEKLGDGVTEVGSGGGQFRNKDGMSSDAKGTVIGMMESQAELNQRIAKLFGEQNIGNRDAIEAANIKRKLDLADQYGVHPTAQKHYETIKEEYDRLVSKIKGDGVVTRNKAATGSVSDTGASSADSSAKHRSSSSGISSGSTSVIRVELPGRSYNVDTTTDEGRSQLQEALRHLGQAKARAA